MGVREFSNMDPLFLSIFYTKLSYCLQKTKLPPTQDVNAIDCLNMTVGLLGRGV